MANVQPEISKILKSGISQYCWIGNQDFMANEENKTQSHDFQGALALLEF